MELRKLIQENLERGKVDFNLWIEKDTTAVGGVINADAVANYVAQMKQISAECLGGVGCLTENIWETLVRLPEVVQTSAVETLEPEEWQVVSEIVNEAIAHLADFRKQEGEALYAKFCKNLDTIEGLMKQLEPFEVSRVEKIRQRLTERLAELKGVDYDKCRLEQELIYYIEKLDINEEKQRLANHLEYFKQTMLNGSGQGKKLGFIAQEMGREINTTGSKSNQAEMQNIVVMMKDELEQIKEQVLNVM
jgi:uncharacterized protein (TIGR00255 family)